MSGELISMRREAVFSPDRKHRYLLRRVIDATKPTCLWVMMNPSRANETLDDHTTKYAMKRAFLSGFGVYEAVNLWPVVCTDSRPVAKMQHHQLFGDEGYSRANYHIRHLAKNASQIVIAWGAAAGATKRANEVLLILKNYKLWCLGLTKHGYPRFPRAIPHSSPLVLYEPIKEKDKE